MTQLRKLSFAALAVTAMLSVPVIADEASEKEGLRIAQARKEVNRGWDNTVASITMTLRNAQGQEATREMRVKTLEVPTDGDNISWR